MTAQWKDYATEGKLLRAEDLPVGRELNLVIERTAHEQIAGEDKRVIYFRGKKKGMGLNFGNRMVLEELFGKYCDECVGKSIVLYTVPCVVNGQPRRGLRIRGPNQQFAEAAQQPVSIPPQPAVAPAPVQPQPAPPPIQPSEQPPAQPAPAPAEQVQGQPPEWVADPPPADDIPF